MRRIAAFGVGCLFGIGLLISGMTDTTKVQGWLDIFGAWDPTLAFVMGGAIVPMAIAWRMTRNSQPVLGGSFPARSDPRLGLKLIVGSVLFGVGWGLSGLCPGPAIASLSFGGWQGAVFGLSLIGGMALAPLVHARLDARFANA